MADVNGMRDEGTSKIHVSPIPVTRRSTRVIEEEEGDAVTISRT